MLGSLPLWKDFRSNSGLPQGVKSISGSDFLFDQVMACRRTIRIPTHTRRAVPTNVWNFGLVQFWIDLSSVQGRDSRIPKLSLFWILVAFISRPSTPFVGVTTP